MFDLPYHGLAHVSRLVDEVEFMYRSQEADAVAIGERVDMLLTEPVEPMPDAHQDMCSDKGCAKGRPLRVPRWVRKMDPSGSKMAGSLVTSFGLVETCPMTSPE